MGQSLYDFWNTLLVMCRIKKEILKNNALDNASNERQKQVIEIKSKILDDGLDSITNSLKHSSQTISKNNKDEK